MKIEKRAASPFTLVLVLLFSGCLSVQKKDDPKLLTHCGQETLTHEYVVRTGGLLESPHDIFRQGNEQLTIRQAILEAGGVRQKEEFGLVETPVSQQVPVIPVVPNPVPSAGSLEILNSIFGNDQKILDYFDVFQIDGDSKEGYSASTSTDPLEYLQDTLFSLTSVVPAPNNRMTENWYDEDVSDWNGLIAMAEKPFEAYRDNDAEFADSAISKLRSLKIALNTSSSDVRPPMATKPSFNVSTKRQTEVLIGLTRSKTPNATVFFHPRLVHQTAIGDVTLHDKDFVFAVRVTDTSLPQSQISSDDFMIPVTGASEEYNAVQHSTHGRLKSILALVPNAERAPDHICIISRPVSGKLGSEVFYLPLSVENTEWTPSDEFVKDGQARPGDSVIFAYAARSPIVYESLIAPVKASFDQKREQLVKESNRRQILPADGKYLSKARANWKYYSQSVVRNTTNVLR